MRLLTLDDLEGGGNNIWYRCERNECAIVFVHGILSDSKSCWTSVPSSRESAVFWPDLIKQDRRFPAADVFLGGYYTEKDAGDYGIDDCATELFSGLGLPDVHGNPTVLSYPRIVFVCHSTGGIVVRYLLESRRKDFTGKSIGLILLASPSDGSKLADVLELLATLYKNKLGKQLKWRNWSLEDLDKRFKNLVHNQTREFELRGIEAYENKPVFGGNRWWPFPRVLSRWWPFGRVVSPESAGKYFGAPRHLPGTDHFSAAKPTSMEHPSHKLLLDFLLSFASSTGYAVRVPVPAVPQAIPEERTTKRVRFNDERKPSQLDLVRAIQQIATTEPRAVYRIPLEFDDRVRGLVESMKRLDADFELKLGEHATASNLAALHRSLNQVTVRLDGLPHLAGLAVDRLRGMKHPPLNEQVAHVLSRTIELCMVANIVTLAHYQLASDPQPLFSDYLPVDGDLASYVAKVDGIERTRLVSYRVRLTGEQMVRSVFVPVDYGQHRLLVLKEFNSKGSDYFPPQSFLTDYLWPQMFFWMPPTDWCMIESLQEVYVKDLQGNYIG